MANIFEQLFGGITGMGGGATPPFIPQPTQAPQSAPLPDFNAPSGGNVRADAEGNLAAAMDSVRAQYPGALVGTGLAAIQGGLKGASAANKTEMDQYEIDLRKKAEAIKLYKAQLETTKAAFDTTSAQMSQLARTLGPALSSSDPNVQFGAMKSLFEAYKPSIAANSNNTIQVVGDLRQLPNGMYEYDVMYNGQRTTVQTTPQETMQSLMSQEDQSAAIALSKSAKPVKGFIYDPSSGRGVAGTFYRLGDGSFTDMAGRPVDPATIFATPGQAVQAQKDAASAGKSQEPKTGSNVQEADQPPGSKVRLPKTVRFNNPGALFDASSNFREFPTAQDGMEAMRLDLMAKVTGRSKAMQAKVQEGVIPSTAPTLSNIIATYSPERAGNDTAAYIDFVALKTGIDPDVPVTPEAVPLIQRAMIEMEGGQPAVEHFYAQRGQVLPEQLPIDNLTPAGIKEVEGVSVDEKFNIPVTFEDQTPPRADIDLDAADKMTARINTNKGVTEFKESLASFQAAVELAQDNSGASDIGLVFNIMKAYDPTSVVRESEQEMLKAAANIAARAGIKGANAEAFLEYAKAAYNGTTPPNSTSLLFGPSVRAEMLKAAHSNLSGRGKRYLNDANAYYRQAEAAQLSPADVGLLNRKAVDYFINNKPNVNALATPRNQEQTITASDEALINKYLQ